MKNFDGLGLHPVLAKSLTQMNYSTPTPIQAQAIPVALEGRDVLGSAQTGTGKTAAFAIPLVEALLNSERKMALVMTPTRELGKQVMDIMHQLLGPKSNIKTAFLIGGESMSKQYAQLQRRPRLIVGTPGRINDHIERRNLMLDQTEFLVLDETDRMLDMGFGVQIDRIVKHISKKRQTLMFSATMPKNIMSMADKYLTNPLRISVGSTFNPVENIDQKILKVTQEQKHGVLVEELHARDGSVIIFVKTKRGADKLARKLHSDGLDADAIHGDLKQRQRDRVIKDFRSKSFRILVATDVVARGLDVPHVAHVINYDLPQMPEDYIHRIGRTARAGAKGESLCLISPQDGRKWFEIEKLMFPDKHPAKPERSGGSGRPKSNGRRKPYAGGPGGSEEQRSFSKKPYSGKPRRDKSGAPGEKTHYKKPYAAEGRPEREAGQASDKPHYNKHKKPYAEGEQAQRDGKPRSKKPYVEGGQSQRDDKPRSKKPYAGGNGRPSEAGDQPRSRKPFKGKSEGGNKPFIKNKKFGGKPGGKPNKRAA